MKAKYIVEGPFGCDKFSFRSKKNALTCAYNMAKYYSLVIEITRKPRYKYGQGIIFVYANGTWRRF